MLFIFLIVVVIFVAKALIGKYRSDKNWNSNNSGLVFRGGREWIDPVIGRKILFSFESSDQKLLGPFKATISMRLRKLNAFLGYVEEPFQFQENNIQYFLISIREKKKEILDPDPIAVTVSLLQADFNPLATSQEKSPEEVIVFASIGTCQPYYEIA